MPTSATSPRSFSILQELRTIRRFHPARGRRRSFVREEEACGPDSTRSDDGATQDDHHTTIQFSPSSVFLSEKTRQPHFSSQSKGLHMTSSSTGSYAIRGRHRRVSIFGLDPSDNQSLEKLMTSEYLNAPASGGFCARLIFRIKTIPNRIIFRLARHDTRAVKQSLRLFPLSFREADMERRFLQSRRSTDHLRSWTVGLLCTFLVALFWIGYTVGFTADRNFFNVNQQFFHTGMTIALVGCLSFILVDILSNRIPCGGEAISLGVLFLVSILVL